MRAVELCGLSAADIDVEQHVAFVLGGPSELGEASAHHGPEASGLPPTSCVRCCARTRPRRSVQRPLVCDGLATRKVPEDRCDGRVLPLDRTAALVLGCHHCYLRPRTLPASGDTWTRQERRSQVLSGLLASWSASVASPRACQNRLSSSPRPLRRGKRCSGGATCVMRPIDSSANAHSARTHLPHSRTAIGHCNSPVRADIFTYLASAW